MVFDLRNVYRVLSKENKLIARSFDYSKGEGFGPLSDLLRDEGKEEKAKEVEEIGKVVKYIAIRPIAFGYPLQFIYQGLEIMVTLRIGSKRHYRLSIKPTISPHYCQWIYWRYNTATTPYVKAQQLFRLLDRMIQDYPVLRAASNSGKTHTETVA